MFISLSLETQLSKRNLLDNATTYMPKDKESSNCKHTAAQFLDTEKHILHIQDLQATDFIMMLFIYLNAMIFLEQCIRIKVHNKA